MRSGAGTRHPPGRRRQPNANLSTKPSCRATTASPTVCGLCETRLGRSLRVGLRVDLKVTAAMMPRRQLSSERTKRRVDRLTNDVEVSVSCTTTVHAGRACQHKFTARIIRGDTVMPMSWFVQNRRVPRGQGECAGHSSLTFCFLLA